MLNSLFNFIMNTFNIKNHPLREIINTYSIPEILVEWIENLEFSSVSEFEEFISSKLRYLHNPFLLKDMENAVSRIRTALKRSEPILIYGDRDVDGVTSTALMYHYLTSFKSSPIYCKVPEDSQDYGLHTDILTFAKENHIKLIITVDCGITAIKEAKIIKENNIDVIITDHHTPDDDIPDCVAVINPKRHNCTYPFKELAGVGVAFKLCNAIELSYDPNFPYNKIISVADIETTGFSPDKNEIIEIACVKTRNGIVIDEYSTLVKPKGYISPEITRLTGITNEMANNGTDLYSAIMGFDNFIKDSTLCGHNLRLFDAPFINKAYLKTLKKPFEPIIIDTLEIARNLIKDSGHSLQKLIHYFSIDNIQTHRALDDCKQTASLLTCLNFTGSEKYRSFFSKYCEIACIGTICDMVSLKGENRIFVKWGLKRLTQCKFSGIEELFQLVFPKKWRFFLESEDISFQIGPRINSAYRMGSSQTAIDLFSSLDQESSKILAKELDSLNEKRKELQADAFNFAINYFQNDPQLLSNMVLVCHLEDFPRGVCGLVASGLVKEYQKPVFVISGKDEKLTGSARALGNTHVLSLLKPCESLLLKYGGHQYAGGFTIEKQNLSNFTNLLIETANSLYSEKDLEESAIHTISLTYNELTPQLIESIKLLEPFGVSNPNPIFEIPCSYLSDIQIIGKTKTHLSAKLLFSNLSIKVIGFNMADKISFIEENPNSPVKFQFTNNFFNGKLYTQAMIISI